MVSIELMEISFIFLSSPQIAVVLLLISIGVVFVFDIRIDFFKDK